jgi:hypothetical protein
VDQPLIVRRSTATQLQICRRYTWRVRVRVGAVRSENGVILTLYIDGSSRRNVIDVCPPSRLHRGSVPYEAHAGFYSVIEIS